MTTEFVTPELEAELEFLRWYAASTDFGPADGDVQAILRENYTEETGNPVPVGWRTNEDDYEDFYDDDGNYLRSVYLPDAEE